MYNLYFHLSKNSIFIGKWFITLVFYLDFDVLWVKVTDVNGDFEVGIGHHDIPRRHGNGCPTHPQRRHTSDLHPPRRHHRGRCRPRRHVVLRWLRVSREVTQIIIEVDDIAEALLQTESTRHWLLLPSAIVGEATSRTVRIIVRISLIGHSKILVIRLQVGERRRMMWRDHREYYEGSITVIPIQEIGETSIKYLEYVRIWIRISQLRRWDSSFKWEFSTRKI